MARARSERRHASVQPATYWTGFISPCASNTWRRRPRDGPLTRRASARTRRGWLMRSSTSAGVSGTVSALDLIGETLTWLEGMAEAALTAAAKATALLRGLETYVSG